MKAVKVPISLVTLLPAKMALIPRASLRVPSGQVLLTNAKLEVAS